jgi:prophage antirepressor-like protein
MEGVFVKVYRRENGYFCAADTCPALGFTNGKNSGKWIIRCP